MVTGGWKGRVWRLSVIPKSDHQMYIQKSKEEMYLLHKPDVIYSEASVVGRQLRPHLSED